MTDVNHSQEKEALEDATNRALAGVGTVAFTQRGYWVTHDDGSVTPPGYSVTFTPAKAAPPSDPSPVSPPPPPPTDPVEPPPSDTSGFKYVRGLAVIPPTYPANYPSVGGQWTDPTTGAMSTRFTDQSQFPGDGGGMRNVYSRYPCESCDGSMVLGMGVGSPAAWVMDRVTGKTIRAVVDAQGRPIGETNELHWSYTDRDTIYFVQGMQFWQFSVSTGTATLIRDFSKDFPGANLIMTDVEGDSSHDSRYWCWQAKVIPASGSYYPIAFFTYDRVADKILGTMTFESWGLPQGDTTPAGRMPTPNMVEVSPDGRFALVDWSRCWGTGTDPNKASNGNLAGTHADGPHVYPLDFDTSKAVKVGVDATHSSWALNAAGKWVFVSQNNRNDWVEAADPDTGDVVQIINQSSLGWGTGYHFCGSPGAPGWVLMSTYANTDTEPGDNQIILLPIAANGNPLRVTPSYNLHKDYFSEGAASWSVDGLRIYWPGNWGAKQPVDMYRVDLPSDWLTQV